MLSLLYRHREETLRQQCEEWFLSVRHRLLAYARQQSDGMTDVELLVGKTLDNVVTAYCKGHLPYEDLLPYTLRSLYHEAGKMRVRNAKRMESERLYSEQQAVVTAPLSPEEGLSDELLQLRRAVQQLPQELSAVVVLKIWDELPLAEVARRLHCPESTVRDRYAAALKQIRRLLEPHDTPLSHER